MQLNKKKIVGLLLIILLSGCALLHYEEDTVIMSSLPKVKNQFQPKMVWSHLVDNVPKDFYSTLQLESKDNYVFAANRYGIVKALDIDSGREIWSKDLTVYAGFFSRNRPPHFSGGLTASRNRVYIGSESAKVYAIYIQDGTLAWKARVPGEIVSSPKVSHGIVLVHTNNGILQALNENNGEVKWTFYLDVPTLTLRSQSTPLVAFDTIVVGESSGCVSAITMEHGWLIWKQCISQTNNVNELNRMNDVKISQSLINNIVYAVAYNGNFSAIDFYSGQVVWSKQFGAATNPLLDGSRIYLVTQNDQVISMDARNGMILWSQNGLLYRNLTSPILHRNYIIVGDSQGYLHWINAENGKFLAQQKVDSSGIITPPIIADDKLIVQAKNSRLYSFNY